MNKTILLIILLALCCIVVWEVKYRRNDITTTGTKTVLIDQVKNKLRPLAPQYVDKLEFYENNLDAFTLNKKEVHLCLKKDTGEYYDDNMIMYAAIHELAHAMYQGDSSEHPPDYLKLFQSLLNKATAMGLYNPSLPIEDDYCDIEKRKKNASE